MRVPAATGGHLPYRHSPPPASSPIGALPRRTLPAGALPRAATSGSPPLCGSWISTAGALYVVLAAGARAPLRRAAPPSRAGTRGDGNFVVILVKWRDSLVTLRVGVRRSREKLRFLASVAIFLLQRAGFPGGCQVLWGRSCFAGPFGTDSLKTAPGAGGESVPNGP
jgi:hypothetical protein